MTNPFSNVKFDRKNHHYSIDGKTLIPTTEFLKRLEPEVDWTEKAKSVAIREGISTDLILKKWKDSGDIAAEKGIEVHRYIERRLKFKTEPDTKYSEMIAWDAFWKSAQDSLIEPYQVEWVIGDYQLGIGGTIDFLPFSSRTQKYHIFDWKTNGKFTLENQWQNLLPPFDDLEDCHLVRYSLQLSVYKVILQENTDLDLGKGYIIWLNSNYLGESYHKFEAIDYTDRVKKWISDLCKIHLDKI